ncbi:NYN domain-containing protein [Chlorobaculum thiosulfatiphilum]|uniref:NYN domain-containing protein n=1 Tax=Chlorobaculum thiosulfatiphilum TaxID=115852 RepID=A0A5C4SAE4_CHLTI|nr:NYN domain-containing protein [Chlorobaculum thiosulfatiphilum]TNJ39919.1 NYN domain-containing protein [Chlorobaculum thiosulfatiphilum]
MGLNVFWDNSNIWLVGRGVCEQREPGDEADFRIHFAKLFDFAVDNRQVDFAYLGGSIPPNNDNLWNRFNDLGVAVEKQERGVATGGEVAVDEAIQLAMANRILDCDEPSRMVLLTGDGNGYDEGKGFIKQLERAVKHGWEVEVISWEHGCNRHLRKFAQEKGIYRPLEPVYENVSFINNKRWAK